MGYGQNNQNQERQAFSLLELNKPGERGCLECIPGDVLGACRDE